MAKVNKQFPWFRFGTGLIPNLNRCSFAEQGILLNLAVQYLHYDYIFPEDLPFALGQTPEEIEAAWTPKAQWCWPYVKQYLDDERDSNLAVRATAKEKWASRKEKKEVDKESEGK